ncbi:MAG: hypothetical protein Kow0022_10420 [Phycisphaerales bacterium]
MIRKATLMLIALAGYALAQQPAQNANELLLAGPRVAESNMTGLTSNFIEDEGNDRARMLARGSAALLRQILPELRAVDDPQLRLTAEQDAAISRLLQDFQARNAAFERQHARELRQLRQLVASRQTDRRTPERASPPAQPTDRDTMVPAQEPMLPEMDARREEAQQRLAELNAERPNPADLEKPIRAVLSERQRTYLDQRIEEIARERFEQRAIEQARKDVAKQFAKQQASRPATDRLTERLPERLRQRIESLPPEQRAAALERLRKMAEQRTPQRDARPARPSKTDKPAPSMDQVQVPRPGGG